MRLIPDIRSRFIAAEHGFSMIIVMGVMAASSLFVAAAFAAANGDLPLTRDSQDRKQAYAAAEAGINYYQYHLNQDPDYWTRCMNVPAPNATENQPVNQKWHHRHHGPAPLAQGRGHPDRVHARADAGHRLLDLRREQPRHDDRPGDGHVRGALDRAPARDAASSSGASSHSSAAARSSTSSTSPTTRRPTRSTTRAATQDWAGDNCANRYRASRDDNCLEIQFADADAINGPFHTNDDILTCGTPVFGRNSADSIEFSGPAPGYTKVSGCGASGDPVFNGPRRAGVKTLGMPPTNATLLTVASQPGGLVYTGKTAIRFNGATNNMTVTNSLVNGGSPQTRALPTNGVIYVKNNTGLCGATYPPPSDATYSEPTSCGNLYVSGTYTSSLTLAAANDIIIAPPGSHAGPTAAPATAT